MRFSEKIAVVTGAASGIGRAVSRVFLKEGAVTYLVDSNANGIKEAVDELEEPMRLRAIARVVDVSNSDRVREFSRTMQHDRIHVLINAAGVGVFDKSIERTEEDEWDRVLAINLKSVYLVSRAMIPLLKQGAPSVILNIASPHAFATGPGLAPYAASKGGVVALSRQMAFDLVDAHIRVNAIIPGPVDTPMLRSQAVQQNTTLASLGFHSEANVMGRIATSDEFARGLVLMALEDASFINASPIFIDGGLLARL